MATNDLVTIEEARSALRLGVTDVELEPELVRLVTSASTLFDDYFGNMVVETVTDELHDNPRYGRPVILRQRPVNSITSVYVDDVLVDAAGYAAPAGGPGNHLYYLESSQYSYWRARTAQGIKVTYVAGRFANTAAVPAKVKDACILQLRHMWRPSQHSAGEVNEFDVAAVIQVTAGLARGIKNMFPEYPSAGVA